MYSRVIDFVVIVGLQLNKTYLIYNKKKKGKVKMNLLDRVSEAVEKSESFSRIMADGIVDDAEIEAQGKLVEDLISKLETQLSDADFQLVSQLIAELSVFNVISNCR